VASLRSVTHFMCIVNTKEDKMESTIRIRDRNTIDRLKILAIQEKHKNIEQTINYLLNFRLDQLTKE